MVDALRILLEEHGYAVLLADSLQSAHSLADAGVRPDVVLLDVVLPDGDGLELLRLWPAGSGTAVLALTGHADEITRERCLQAGCRDVLVKPVSSGDLLRKLDELFS